MLGSKHFCKKKKKSKQTKKASKSRATSVLEDVRDHHNLIYHGLTVQTGGMWESVQLSELSSTG